MKDSSFYDDSQNISYNKLSGLEQLKMKNTKLQVNQLDKEVFISNSSKIKSPKVATSEDIPKRKSILKKGVTQINNDNSNFNIKINIFNSYNDKLKKAPTAINLNQKKFISQEKLKNLENHSVILPETVKIDSQNFSLSKRWRRLTNVIKTVSFLHKYDAVPLKEIDIDHNLNDYKDRLLPNSPLRQRKLTKQEHIKNQEKMKYKTPQKLISSNFTLNKYTHNKNFSNLMEEIIENSEIPSKREHSSPNKSNKYMKSSKNKNSIIEEKDSYFKQEEESEDEVLVEMNKISLIERIKIYIEE